jgi:hypothetical protein
MVKEYLSSRSIPPPCVKPKVSILKRGRGSSMICRSCFIPMAIVARVRASISPGNKPLRNENIIPWKISL